MIVHANELADLRADANDATVALRFGSYDLLHAGHQAGIDYAKSQADILVLGIMPDEYVSRVKGLGRPINSEAMRIATIDAIGVSNYTFIAPAGILGVARTFLRLRPDVYIEGQEHAESQLKALFLNVLGIQHVVDRQPRITSTTEMIEHLGLSGAVEYSNVDFRFEPLDNHTT